MNPFVPMLSITGNPTRERLETHLGRFLQNSVDQFMIYARTGLEAEYMSEDWHRICKICIDFARRNNMGVWLYDEYNWPSGSCKNAVTNLNKNFIASRFEYKNGVVTVEKMGANETNMAIDPFCVDMLNPDAVKSFINLTHDRYYEWFKEDFGKTIKGFYSDEPSFDYSTSNDNQLPFYDGLIEDYKNACGRDIFADAKDYFEGKKSADFYEVYAKLIGDKFCNSYFKTVGEWCEKHNVVFTGHLVADDSLLGSVKATGDAFACLKEMQMPGCDDIYSAIDPKTDLVYTQMEYIKQSCNKPTMAELFALGEASMTFTKMKQIIWYAAMHGIDTYFILSLLDNRGSYVKDNYFFSFSPDMPNFCGVRDLIDTAKKAAEYANKKLYSEIDLRYPKTETARNIGEKKNNIDELYFSLTDALIENQLPWKLIVEDDNSTAKYILSVKGNSIIEENSGAVFNTANECISSLFKDYEYKICVTEPDGSIAKNILLKQYQNGAFAVLDRRETEGEIRKLILVNNGENSEFELLPLGVYTDLDKTPHYETVSLINEYKVKRSDTEVLRPYMSKREIEMEIPKNTEFYFNVRQYPKPSKVYLNGKLLRPENKSDKLTEGLNPLYLKTEKILLEKGSHTVASTDDEKDFLPIIIGEYKKEEGEDFYNKISVDFEIKTAASTEQFALAFDNCKLATELYLEGELISVKSVTPFIFEIPKAYNGKTLKARLVFYSSFAPLFGKVTDPKLGWGRRISNPEKLSFKNLRIVKKCK